MATYNKSNPDTIRQLFNSIAKNYDRTNAVLSFCLHKQWNKALIDQVIVPKNPNDFLDLCCGTGAIAFDYLRKTSIPVNTHMLDFSEQMLEYAKIKSAELDLKHPVSYLKADAQDIPLDSNSIDCVTIAYGIRNIPKPDLCLKEIFRVLRTGGVVGILELTEPENPLLRIGHKVYLNTVLPVVGKLMTSNQDAYQYLCKSIHNFISPQDLEALMKAAGFKQVHRRSLTGGIATLLYATK